MSARSLLKLLKRHAATEAEAQALLACRDALLAEQQRRSVGELGDVRVDTLAFNERTDEIGHGRYGHVFRCRLGEEEELLAVKRVERLRFEQMGGRKEVNVLLHVQIWGATHSNLKNSGPCVSVRLSNPRPLADSQAPCVFEAAGSV